MASSRVRELQLSLPPQWLPAARRVGGAPLAATTHPVVGLGPWLSLSPMGMVPCSGWGHSRGAGDTKVLVLCPRCPLLQPSPGQEAWGATGPRSLFFRDVPTACAVSTWRDGAGRTRHVCVFPGQDVRLFTQLHLRVLDATSNQTKYWRELSVDVVGESLPLGNSRVTPGQSPDLGPLPFCPPGGAGSTLSPTRCAQRQPWGHCWLSPGRSRGRPDRGYHRRTNAPARSPQVSSPPQQTSQPAGLGLRGSSTCRGSRHSSTT